MVLCFFKGWALCQAWLQKRPCWNWTVSYVKYIPHATLLYCSVSVTCFQKFFMNLFRQEVWILNPHLFKNEMKICQKLLHHLHYHVQHSDMTLNASLCFCFWRYKRGGNVVIFREIHAENNQSLWMLNDRQCSQKAVEEEVKALRIQVSNLCQFLPQVCLYICNIKLHRCKNIQFHHCFTGFFPPRRKKWANLPRCPKLSCWKQLRSQWAHQRCMNTTVSSKTSAIKNENWR